MSSTMPSRPHAVRQTIDAYLADRESLSKEAFESDDSLALAGELSALTDAFLVTMWEAASSEVVFAGSALVALGGYGRRELSFGSDLDLMIELGDEALLDDPDLHTSVERLLTWCRDARLAFGHAVRTPAQTLDEFEQDPRTTIAMVDARPLQDEAHVDWQTVRAKQAVDYLRGDDEGVGFVELLMEGYAARLERNGKTIYLLEPDIKSGEGGLRDLNCLHWAGRVRWGFAPASECRPQIGWSEQTRQAYRDGLCWLLRLRHLLHINHGRQHDRLSFPDQEKIAAHMVSPGDDEAADRSSMTERLMRHHYREARSISMLTQRLLRRWKLVDSGDRAEVGSVFCLSNGQLAVRNGNLDGPLEATQVIEALEEASTHEALLDPVLEMSIAWCVSRWGDSERADAELNQRFRRLLTDLDTSPKTSERLLENGILTRLIPEFEPIVCHVQHDVYHVYTTDIHSLKCLEKARRLVAGAHEGETGRWGLFAAVASEIANTEVFLLAALFHDIGKNRGGDHSRRGAEMMNDIGQRLHMQSSDIDQLAFLVREHLTLSDTARRRDLSDPRVVREIAARVRTVETLNLLTALTFCDMSTVGPDVMTDWNATLIGELYHRLRQAIEDGLESLWRDRQALVERHRQALWELSSEADDELASAGELRSQLDAFVRELPTEHFAATAPDALARQFAVFRRARGRQATAVAFFPMVERGATEIIVCAQDVPGTLAKIAGVISASGLNIMSAQIVTTAGGRTLDIFQVSQSAPRASLVSQRQPRPPEDPRRLERLEDKLTGVLEGEISVDSLLNQRISETRLSPRPTPPVKTLVDVRQDVSDAFTVIEVRAGDRMGLLYEIACTLWDQGVSTHLSKIDSLGTQIIDTFYVESLEGGKLSGDKTGEVANALYETLERSPYLDESPND